MPDYLVQIYVRQPHGKPDGVVAVVHLVPICECARRLVLLRCLLHGLQLICGMGHLAERMSAGLVAGLHGFGLKPEKENHSI